MSEDGLRASLAKMTQAGMGPEACEGFARQYHKLEKGATGLIPEASIAPLLDVPQFDATAPIDESAAREAMSHLVIIKLNGGLGTSMGLDGPKSLLPVHSGRSFLDLIVAQVLAARRRWGVELPLLLMNSFGTQDATAQVLARYPELPVRGMPSWFVQSREPKLRADDLTPVSWPADPTLEWCPPGHGDVYDALADSGLLDELIEAGFWYAFVSNADNLGASPHAGLASWFVASGAPYAAEICRRTANDTKGGHLAIRRADGRLILRDTAQTPPDELDYFTDQHRHPFFHSNNLWWDLRVVRRELADGSLDLPIIRNAKTVDPTDPASTPVIQIETAMGTAIEAFAGAQAIAVPRDRLVPVKKTNELLLLRSDLYEISQEGELRAQVAVLPRVELGDCYQFVSDFDARIPAAPSLREASSLVVDGDWTFGRDVHVKGDVLLPDDGGTHRVPDGALLDGAMLGHTRPESLAQAAALVRQILAAVEPHRNAAVLRRPGGALDAEDRRLIADLPPHHGRVG